MMTQNLFFIFFPSVVNVNLLLFTLFRLSIYDNENIQKWCSFFATVKSATCEKKHFNFVFFSDRQR
jgi:hypothetical protein